MRTSLLACVVGIACWMSSVVAMAQPSRGGVSVTLGGTVVSIPPIVGFRVPSESEREILSIVRPSVPPGHRLLATFFAESDLQRFAAGREPRIDQFQVAQVARRVEALDVTVSEFQGVRRAIKDDHSVLVRALTPAQRRQIDAIERGGPGLMPSLIQVSFAEPLPLGTIEDHERAVGIHYLTRAFRDEDGGRADRISVAASIAVWVRSRILYLDALCVTPTADDFTRCRKQLRDWIAAVQATNR